MINLNQISSLFNSRTLTTMNKNKQKKKKFQLNLNFFHMSLFDLFILVVYTSILVCLFVLFLNLTKDISIGNSCLIMIASFLIYIILPNGFFGIYFSIQFSYALNILFRSLYYHLNQFSNENCLYLTKPIPLELYEVVMVIIAYDMYVLLFCLVAFMPLFGILFYILSGIPEFPITMISVTLHPIIYFPSFILINLLISDVMIAISNYYPEKFVKENNNIEEQNKAQPFNHHHLLNNVVEVTMYCKA